MGGRSIDHELKAVFRRRELGYVVFRVGPPYVLLHRPIALFLPVQSNCYRQRSARSNGELLGAANAGTAEWALTPRQRLRQLEPS